MHYASELTKKQAHNEFEDTDMIRLMLEYDGDINIHTKLVSINSINLTIKFNRLFHT